jgi:hypothetical protein
MRSSAFRLVRGRAVGRANSFDSRPTVFRPNPPESWLGERMAGRREGRQAHMRHSARRRTAGTLFALSLRAMGFRIGKLKTGSPDLKGATREKQGAERRRYPRVTLQSPLYAHLGSGNQPFLVREVSSGGFSIEADRSFAVGTEHTFQFEIPSGPAARVKTLCRYCTLVSRDGEPRSYMSGFEFLPQPSQNLRPILGAIATNTP